ncbi:nuclear transport factor 2 family protein [Alteromonas sediminis]|nr:nuclear transport factor 2 family protein [Alteromonas sediminis]
MKYRILNIKNCVCVLLTSITLAICSVQAKPTLNDYQNVALTIQKYFDGTQFGKKALVKEAFTETLFIQWINAEGEFKSRDASSYIGNITEGKHTPRYGHIVSIDITNNAASAKVEIDWGERTISDYLLLLKIDGKWKITNKIATVEPKQ